MRAVAMPVLLLAACGAAPRETAVDHVGPMREVMRDGRTEARARLAEHAGRGTFGVGALTGLAGEVLIDDGAVWIARGDAAAVPAAADATATLLTTARVHAWREVTLPATADAAALELAIAAAAPVAAARGDVIPFVVDGRGRVALHVVRGTCPHGSTTPGREPVRWSADGVALRCVGFFVRGREGLLTHHGTALHVHAFANDGARRVMGHVDELALDGGAVLRLPADRR